MKLVIDIPEKDYEKVLKMRPAYPDGVFCWIKAIQNGTPVKEDEKWKQLKETISEIRDM